MNRIYRTLWNAELGRMVVASELARSRHARRTGVLVAGLALALPLTALAQATAVGVQVYDTPTVVDATTVAHYVQASGSTDSDAGAYVEGDNALAAGEATSAIGNGATALAGGAIANGDGATAVGHNSLADGRAAVALGMNATASGDRALALGNAAKAQGLLSMAIGDNATAESIGAMAIGTNAVSRNDSATSVGASSISEGLYATATGFGAKARKEGATALGANALALGDYAVAVGVGAGARAKNTVAIGSFSSAWADDSTVVGPSAQAMGVASTSVGNNALTRGQLATAIGFRASVGEMSTAIGAHAASFAASSTLLGASTLVRSEATGSVAIGVGSLANRPDTVSVGASEAWTYHADNPARTRQIVNVAAGTEANDAVNLAQLEAATALNRYIGVNGNPDSDAGAYAEGDDTLAAGEAASAVGQGATALGGGALAYADTATAIGKDSLATGASSTALGGMLQLDYSAASEFGVVLDQQTAANGLAATALGAGARADDDFNTAIGAQTETSGKSAVAIGGIVDVREDQLGEDFAGVELQNTRASGRLATAIGGGAQATDYAATAIGALAGASGIRAVAIGYASQATAYDATAIGDRAEASEEWATAIGSGARATHVRATALGSFATAIAAQATAVGEAAMANGVGATALGSGAWAAAENSISIGKSFVWNSNPWREETVVFADGIAMGTNAEVHGSRSIALGAGATVGGWALPEVDGLPSNIDDAVALGAGAIADRSNTVSIGRNGAERQITNVAAGTQATDAVNLSQLEAVAADASRYLQATGSADSDAGAYAEGDNTLAAGEAAAAVGTGTVALGAGAVSYANNATALGRDSLAVGESSTALGGVLDIDYSALPRGVVIHSQTAASGLGATAAGAGAQANGDFNTAIGAQSETTGKSAVAIGGIVDVREDEIGSNFMGQILRNTKAAGRLSTAIGGGAQATEYAATAIGALAEATAIRSIAIGYRTQATAYDATAIGDRAQATFDFTTAIGSGARASAKGTTVIGSNANALYEGGTALGNAASARNVNAVALGTASAAAGQNSIAIGNRSMVWNGDFFAPSPILYLNSIAIGVGTNTYGSDSIALGTSAIVGRQQANGLWTGVDNSVALGANSWANRENTISVGRAGAERQITNVAAGTEATDAVNLAQLDAVAGGLGELSANAVIYDDADKARISLAGADGTVITNVAAGELTEDSTDAVNGSQLFETNTRVTAVEGRVDDLGTRIGDVAGVAQNAVAYDDADKARISLAGADGTVITNVAAGDLTEDSTDAVNGSQLFETNTRVTQVEGRVDDLDTRIGDVAGVAQNAVAYDDADKARISLAGADGTVITNVAAGELTEDSTDAVNGSQLFETNTRVTAVEGRVDDLDTRIGDVAGVAQNAVAYDDVDKGRISLAGADGTVLSNLAAGAVSADSTQAINGAQLHGGLQSMADILGGGAAVTAFGTLAAPSYAVQGTQYASIGATFAALDVQISQLKTRVGSVETVIDSNQGTNDRVAVGGDAPATVGADTNAVAVGGGAAANGANGVALGGDAYAHGPNDTAVGGNAQVHADGSTAVGANSRISADATNAVAIGESASVTAASGTALGQGASVTAQGAVALGQGSVADRAQTVSVGSAGAERQIANVAAGTQATDAANVAQVRAGVTEAKAYADTTATQAVASSKAYTDQRLAAWGDQFDAYRGDVERRFSDVDRRMDRQGAMSAAMLNMATNAAGTQSPRGRVAVGAGFQSGEQALSIGYAKRVGERASFSLGGAFSGDEKSAGFGFGIDL
ncbi:ESPR-type extended signal peptide-containing protein [Luteimonas sp. gir]|uniref:ESPR-type extended signal peptide-containing protein n=1 Tax=Luteimonas sp. gir TaxID=3127960 RepID=UPI003075E88A